MFGYLFSYYLDMFGCSYELMSSVICAEHHRQEIERTDGGKGTTLWRGCLDCIQNSTGLAILPFLVWSQNYIKFFLILE